jgi:cyclic beta-1,2-glucan synthetase
MPPPIRADRPPFVRSLRTRLDESAATLLVAYKASAAELESGRGVPLPPNGCSTIRLVEDQIRKSAKI